MGRGRGPQVSRGSDSLCVWGTLRSQEQMERVLPMALRGKPGDGCPQELVGGAEAQRPVLMPPLALQTETLLLQAERRALCACWPAGR